jgi:hypothetical protein
VEEAPYGYKSSLCVNPAIKLVWWQEACFQYASLLSNLQLQSRLYLRHWRGQLEARFPGKRLAKWVIRIHSVNKNSYKDSPGAHFTLSFFFICNHLFFYSLIPLAQLLCFANVIKRFMRLLCPLPNSPKSSLSLSRVLRAFGFNGIKRLVYVILAALPILLLLYLLAKPRLLLL